MKIDASTLEIPVSWTHSVTSPACSITYTIASTYFVGLFSTTVVDATNVKVIVTAKIPDNKSIHDTLTVVTITATDSASSSSFSKDFEVKFIDECTTTTLSTKGDLGTLTSSIFGATANFDFDGYTDVIDLG